MGMMENAHTNAVLEDMGVNGRIILKWILNRDGVE
jgi:hypothetical protein